MHDLDELALLRPKQAVPARHPHAVVLGGSWTGLLTAAVLSPYFDRVTIVERDTADETTQAPPGRPRRGVPHGAQSHMVLPYAVRFVKALLADFETSLQQHGGNTGGDMGVDFDWYHRGGWRLRRPLGLPMWFASRALVEWTLRHEVLRSFDNITFQSSAVVEGFAVGDDVDTLSGVHLSDTQGPRTVDADLVVDCTGKNSRATRWLHALGYPRIEEVCVDAKTFYATCRLRRTASALRSHGHWARTLHGAPGPQGGHFAGAITVENGDLCVWAVRAGAKPPMDRASFDGFLAALEVPDFYRHATDANHVEPESGDINVFGAGPARRRAYEKASRLPHNFVALGDAACSTDPAFGLGLSLSASTVAALAAALHARQPSALSTKPWNMRDFGREMAKRVAWRTSLPWLLTAAEDYRFCHTRGPHRGRLWVRALQAYIDRAFSAAHVDPRVDALVLRVVGLVAHPLHVFGPLILGRVLLSHNFTLEVADECSIEANLSSR